jgi:hypothetical protein
MDTENNLNIIEQLMANERKNRAWASMASVLFVITACGFILFAYRWNNQKNRFQNRIQRQTDSLAQINNTLERELKFSAEKDSIIASLGSRNPSVARALQAILPENVPAEDGMEDADTRSTAMPIHEDDAAMAPPEVLIEEYPTGAGTAASPAPDQKDLYKIYIQYEEAQLHIAQKAREVLREARFARIPPMEKMNMQFPSEVRYFSRKDSNQAIWIQAILKKEGIPMRISFHEIKSVRPHLIELWFGSKND